MRSPSFALRFTRQALFIAPLLLWMALLFWGGAERARYETSWRWIQQTLRFLCPEFAPPGDGSEIQIHVNMYQLNGALRRLAHIGGYAVLACLTVRFLQQGRPRLRRRSIAAALLLSLLYTGFDELHRYLQPNRHAKWLDLFLNLSGAVLVLAGTVGWFQFKEWERRLEAVGIEAEQGGEETVSDEQDQGNAPEGSAQPGLEEQAT